MSYIGEKPVNDSRGKCNVGNGCSYVERIAELEEHQEWLNERHRDIHERKNIAQKVADEALETNRWRDVNEELPEEDTICLMFVPHNDYAIMLFDGESFVTQTLGTLYNSKNDFKGRKFQVKYWKPVTPPTEEEK